LLVPQKSLNFKQWIMSCYNVSHFKSTTCTTNIFLFCMETLAIWKFTHITLVFYGAYDIFPLSWVVERQNSFWLEHYFSHSAQFSYRRFCDIFKRKLNVPQMVLSCRSNGVWFSQRHIFEIAFSSYFYKAYMELKYG